MEPEWGDTVLESVSYDVSEPKPERLDLSWFRARETDTTSMRIDAIARSIAAATEP